MLRPALLLALALVAAGCPDDGPAAVVPDADAFPTLDAASDAAADVMLNPDAAVDALDVAAPDGSEDIAVPDASVPDAVPDAPQADASPDAVVVPNIGALSPADGTKDVAADTPVTMVLSGPVPDGSAADLTLATYPGGVSVDGTLSWDGTNSIATFTPSAALDGAATYRITGSVDADSVTALFTVASQAAPSLAPLTTAQEDAIADAVASARSASALSGHTFSGFILDLTSGETVYAGNPDTPRIPASNTKVFTTAAAISLLGEDYRFLTRVYADGPIGGGGTLTGDLYLHGQHDFTWSRWFYPSQRYPLDVLADRLWDAGLRTVSGDVSLYGAYCYEGHHFASYSPATHRAKVETAFVAALEARGITVNGNVTSNATMALPPGQTELASWESLPLWVAIWAINRKSHNEMADVLNRHIGWMQGGSSDYATGSAEILAWLDSEGFDTTGMVLEDGSGLDTDNRITGRQLASLYDLMDDLPEGRAWKTSLAIGGGGGPGSTDSSDSYSIVLGNSGPYNGTLAFRMNGADVAGRFFGKSGTNAGITTSGELWHAYDGHRYAIGLEMNNISSGAGQYGPARSAQDAIITAVAANFRGVGPRPDAPTLRTVDADPEVGTITASWTPVTGVAGYVLRRWNGTTEFTQSTTFTDIGIAVGGARYYEVAAVSSEGVYSPWSDVYGARVGASSQPRVLIVDANDRWQEQPTDENDIAGPHPFVERYVRGLVGVGATVVSAADEAVTDLVGGAGDVDAVFWAAGEDSTTHQSISPAQQGWLQGLLEGGVAVFVSGAEIAWELSDGASLAFYNDALNASYVADDSEVYVATGTAGGPFAGILAGFWTPGRLFVAWSDVIAPEGAGATEALTYASGGGAAVASDNQVIVMGFPFESIDLRSTRQDLLEAAMSYFGLAD